MRSIRDWPVSLVTVAAFGLVMVLGDLLQRVTWRLGMDTYERSIGWIQKALIATFRISGVTIDIQGRGLLASRGGYLVVSNHQSMYDIPIFGGVLAEHNPRYVAKRSLAKGIPTVSLYLKRGGNAMIDRNDRDQALASIGDMGKLCQARDAAAVIFPEGTRSRDGSLGDYRTTGLETLMASAPDLPIVPTAIDGSWIVFRDNMFPIPFGTDVRVRFGEPIARTPDEDAEAIAARCRDFTQSTLDEWHRGSERSD